MKSRGGMYVCVYTCVCIFVYVCVRLSFQTFISSFLLFFISFFHFLSSFFTFSSSFPFFPFFLLQILGSEWSCVHGGSTCSICVLVDGLLYTTNVGDSSALLCANYPILNASNIVNIGDAAVSESLSRKYIAHVRENASSVFTFPPPTSTTAPTTGTTTITTSNTNTNTASTGIYASCSSIDSSSSSGGEGGEGNKKTDTLMVTAEHSPESVYEFQRLRGG